MALSEVLTTLQSLSANVASLTKEVKSLRVRIPLLLVIGIAVIGIIVSLKS